jgi:DNA helicase HerA-like ATPase/CRISPR/Cas system-associated exonuclease Cas4 (RecB family)
MRAGAVQRLAVAISPNQHSGKIRGSEQMASPIRFTVSQVRVAATCPRILYFDSDFSRRRNLKQPRVTRIWKEEPGGKTTTALGTLFHNSVEKFNSEAARSADLRRLLATVDDSESLAQELKQLIYVDYIDVDRLYMAEGPQQKHFMDALACYTQELADVLVYGIHEGLPVDTLLDQMFGDQRRKVDVTFHVGPDDTAINVSGILDYLFYDWRRGQRRIIDYKLAPGDQPSMDLYQVCVYALMHHMQHRTEPDVGVLYLHPTRHMKEMTWEQVYAQRHNVYDLLASMAAWVQYDERASQGLKPPGEPVYCTKCGWSKQCVKRLGPTNDGRFLNHWRDAFKEQPTIEPRREVHEIQHATGRGAATRMAMPSEPGQLEIGKYFDDQSPSCLPVSVLTNHVAVVGASGSGKTYMAKVIVEEAIRHRIPVLAIDPQGDLVQFLKPARNPESGGQDSFDAYWSAVEPRILTPGSSHGIRVSLNPLRLPADEDLANLSEAGRKHELNEILAATATNLVNMARAGGDAELQQTYLMQLLRKLINRSDRGNLDLETIAEAAIDPESVGLHDADDYLPKAQRRKLGQKFKARLHGPYANLFRGGRPLDLDELCRGTEDAKTPLNVVYLNALGGDDQKQLILAALATEVYRWMVSSLQANGRVNLLFYVDEARDFIPAGSKKPATKDPLIRLFTQGRKYGVACLMCTQSPRSVDYNVFGNCSTKFIGRLASAQDVDRVADWFSEGSRPDWLADRKNAPAGTFVGHWPGMSPSAEGQPFKSRTLFSVHESAWSPDRVEQEVIEQAELLVTPGATNH